MRKSRTILSPGQVVRELRTKKGWTLAVVSEITGIAVANLSNIERGRTRLGEDRALLLGEALGVKPEFILFPNGYERADLKDKIAMVCERREKYLRKQA